MICDNCKFYKTSLYKKPCVSCKYGNDRKGKEENNFKSYNNKCLFCKSRKCSTRIVRTEAPRYDEVACSKHINDLEKHADYTLGVNNGIMRWHISGYELARGESTPESEVKDE